MFKLCGAPLRVSFRRLMSTSTADVQMKMSQILSKTPELQASVAKMTSIMQNIGLDPSKNPSPEEMQKVFTENAELQAAFADLNANIEKSGSKPEMDKLMHDVTPDMMNEMKQQNMEAAKRQKETVENANETTEAKSSTEPEIKDAIVEEEQPLKSSSK